MGFLFDKSQRDMFADFYNICQKYWNIPDTQEEIDKYWDNLMIEVELFNMKHKEIRLEWYMMEAFLTTQEMKEMEKRSNERNNISGSNDISVSSSA